MYLLPCTVQFVDHPSSISRYIQGTGARLYTSWLYTTGLPTFALAASAWAPQGLFAVLWQVFLPLACKSLMPILLYVKDEGCSFDYVTTCNTALEAPSFCTCRYGMWCVQGWHDPTLCCTVNQLVRSLHGHYQWSSCHACICQPRPLLAHITGQLLVTAPQEMEMNSLPPTYKQPHTAVPCTWPHLLLLCICTATHTTIMPLCSDFGRHCVGTSYDSHIQSSFSSLPCTTTTSSVRQCRSTVFVGTNPSGFGRCC
jgi:hypothetical protein